MLAQHIGPLLDRSMIVENRSGAGSNNGTITFPAPTANWGVVTHVGVYDATTAGNLLFFGALTTNKTVNSGDAAPSFAAAALTVQLDN